MITIKELDRSYNRKMLEILAMSPMKTPAIELHFDKSPDLFKLNELWSENYKYYGIFSFNQLIGFGKHIEFQGYLNKKEETLSYFGDFCIKPDLRRYGYFKTLIEYMTRNCLKENSFGFTVILDANTAANSYFHKKRYEQLPGFKLLPRTLTKTILITGRKDPQSELKIRRANESDINIISKWLNQESKQKDLAPVFSRTMFEKKISGKYGLKIEDYFLAYKKDELVGICGAWKMEGIKSTKVISYSRKFFLFYFIYNLFRKFFKVPRLPKAGQIIPEVYLTDVLVKEDNPAIFRNLLLTIYNISRSQGQNMIHYSTYQRDPLLKAFKPFISISLKSSVYISSLNPQKLDTIITDPQISRPYFDATKI